MTPSRQRQGIGTALVDRLTAELRERDVSMVYSLTLRESPAVRFYETNGFSTDDSVRFQYLSV